MPPVHQPIRRHLSRQPMPPTARPPGCFFCCRAHCNSSSIAAICRRRRHVSAARTNACLGLVACPTQAERWPSQAGTSNLHIGAPAVWTRAPTRVAVHDMIFARNRADPATGHAQPLIVTFLNSLIVCRRPATTRRCTLRPSKCPLEELLPRPQRSSVPYPALGQAPAHKQDPDR